MGPPENMRCAHCLREKRDHLIVARQPRQDFPVADPASRVAVRGDDQLTYRLLSIADHVSRHRGVIEELVDPTAGSLQDRIFLVRQTGRGSLVRIVGRELKIALAGDALNGDARARLSPDRRIVLDLDVHLDELAALRADPELQDLADFNSLVFHHRFVTQAADRVGEIDRVAIMVAKIVHAGEPDGKPLGNLRVSPVEILRQIGQRVEVRGP